MQARKLLDIHKLRQKDRSTKEALSFSQLKGNGVDNAKRDLLENLRFHAILSAADDNWLSHRLIKDAVNDWRRNTGRPKPYDGDDEDEEGSDNGEAEDDEDDDSDDDDDMGNDCDDDSEDEDDAEEEEEHPFLKLQQKAKASGKAKMPVTRNPNRASNGKFASSASGHHTLISSSPPVSTIPSTGPCTDLAKALNICEKVLRKVVNTMQSNYKDSEVNSIQVTQEPITPMAKRPTQVPAADDEEDDEDTPETSAPKKRSKPRPEIAIRTPVPLQKQKSAKRTIRAPEVRCMADRLADEVPIGISLYIQTYSYNDTN